jgi:hypothetical protein
VYEGATEVAKLESGQRVYRPSWKLLKNSFKQFGYEPFAAQKKVHKSLSRVRVLCTGARFGKSYSAAMEVAANLMIPNQQWWIVAEKYELAEKEFRYVWQALVENPDPAIRKLIKGNIINSANNPKIGQMWIRFKWGSWVMCKSIQEPTGLLGEELDGIVLAEGSQIPNSVMQRYIWPRLSSRMGQILIPTTPAGYDDMLYPLFTEGQDKANSYPKAKYPDSTKSWEFPAFESPYYNVEDYERAKRQVGLGIMEQADFDEQFLGKFTSHTGKVYKTFRDDIHVVDPYEIPPSWGQIRGIDVGMDAPTVCLWGRIDTTGAIVITKEYYKEGVEVHQHVQAINRITGDVPTMYTVIDPAAGQHTAANRESVLEQYLEQGLPCIPADNSMTWTRTASSSCRRACISSAPARTFFLSSTATSTPARRMGRGRTSR